jgi:hypothetical protein
MGAADLPEAAASIIVLKLLLHNLLQMALFWSILYASSRQLVHWMINIFV